MSAFVRITWVGFISLTTHCNPWVMCLPDSSIWICIPDIWAATGWHSILLHWGYSHYLSCWTFHGHSIHYSYPKGREINAGIKKMQILSQPHGVKESQLPNMTAGTTWKRRIVVNTALNISGHFTQHSRSVFRWMNWAPDTVCINFQVGFTVSFLWRKQGPR